MQRKKLIKFSIAVPVPDPSRPGDWLPAIWKPDIKSRSKSAAVRKAKALYGNDVIVVEPYTP